MQETLTDLVHKKSFMSAQSQTQVNRVIETVDSYWSIVLGQRKVNSKIEFLPDTILVRQDDCVDFPYLLDEILRRYFTY